MKRYKIKVTAKQGIFDPAGETSRKALASLGFDGVGQLKIGKYIELEVADHVSPDDVCAMCEKLLANPVIEDFELIGD